jgi:hypothetical protein
MLSQPDVTFKNFNDPDAGVTIENESFLAPHVTQGEQASKTARDEYYRQTRPSLMKF